MDAKTRAIFRQAMREIGRKGGEIGALGDHDAGGADRAGEEDFRSRGEEAQGRTVGEGKGRQADGEAPE